MAGLSERRPQGEDSVQVNPAAVESVYIRPRDNANSLALGLLPRACVAERGSCGGGDEWKSSNNIEGKRLCNTYIFSELFLEERQVHTFKYL